MRTKLTKITLTATLALAIAFTLNACSSDSNDDPPLVNGGGNSSSSDGGSSSSISSSSGTTSPYTDKGNDIASYEAVPIGDQVWMAENLNYKVEGSKCYGEDGVDITLTSVEIQSNCDKYGRLYDWVTAMGLPVKCNSTLSTDDADCTIQNKHRGICPSGWHIPSNEEWNELYHYADGTLNESTNLLSNYLSNTAGEHLKAKDGWDDCGTSGSGKFNSCEDTFGFFALPGGFGSPNGIFLEVGRHGYWRSASENNATIAYGRYMDYFFKSAGYNNEIKSYLHSVRCIKD